LIRGKALKTFIVPGQNFPGIQVDIALGAEAFSLEIYPAHRRPFSAIVLERLV